MKLLLPVWEGHMVVSGLANLRPNALITGLRANIDIAAVYSPPLEALAFKIWGPQRLIGTFPLKGFFTK